MTNTNKEDQKNDCQAGCQQKTTDLEKELAECEKEKQDYLSGWKRERADFANYKKGESQRVEGLTKFIHGAFLLRILDLVDSFDLAEKSLKPEAKETEEIKGLLQIKEQFLDFLKSQGVEVMDCLNQEFNPSNHESVAEAEDKNRPPGTIIEEILRGYTLNGKLLRPAKVKISH